MTVALISDTHADTRFATPEALHRMAAQVTGLGPDLIVHGGDFINPNRPFWRAAPVAEAVDALAGLRRPACRRGTRMDAVCTAVPRSSSLPGSAAAACPCALGRRLRLRL